jgi:YVTN family beta-propeller protein
MRNRWDRAAPVALAVVLVLAACGHDSHARPRTRARSQPPTTQATARVERSVESVYAHTGVGQLSPAVAGVPDRVYVPNSEADTVDVIDPASFRVIDHFAVGRVPQHVTPAWDMRTLYVDNDLGNSLTPIDPRTGRAGAPIPVTDPYNLYFTPDGTKAIVVAEKLRRLDFRDPHTWTLLKSVPIPHAGVDHGDFSADGKQMLLSCEFSGWVVRVDIEHMAVTGELHVGGSPVDVKLAPDASVFYVANQARNGVSVVDARSMTEQRFIPTGRGAHGLYPSRDARSLYVSNRLAGSVSVIDFATGHLTATWPTGGSPDMGGVSSDGTQLWLSGRYNAEVYVIDTRTGHVLHRIPVDRGPHGLSVFPQPGRYSLGHTGVFR